MLDFLHAEDLDGAAAVLRALRPADSAEVMAAREPAQEAALANRLEPKEMAGILTMTIVVRSLVWCVRWCGAFVGVVRSLVWYVRWCGTFVGVVRSWGLGERTTRDTRLAQWYEFRTGFLNGLAIGILVGLIAWRWQGSPGLGLVITLAMWGSPVVAGWSVWQCP